MDNSNWTHADDAFESFGQNMHGISTNNVGLNDVIQEVLPNNKSQRLLPGVNELLGEVKQLKERLSTVKEERDEYKEEVRFLKYQLAYRAQVENLQKEMSEKRQEENKALKKQRAVRFSSSVSIDHGKEEEDVDGGMSTQGTNEEDNSCNVEYNRLLVERQELEDVLYDFYHDLQMGNNKARVLVGDTESPGASESMSSLICRILVDYEKLNEEHRILGEEKSKLDEDKGQLCASMAKLREQFHDAVDSNIEEIEDLNRENEELRFKVKSSDEKDSELRTSSVKSHEQTVNRLKSILELTKSLKMENVTKRVKSDISQAEKELKQVKSSCDTTEEEKASTLKRAQSLPSSLRQETPETIERGGLLRELKTCKDLQESQRKQIQKIQEEKLDLEVKLSELKRQNVFLKMERRANIKTKSKLSQTDETLGIAPATSGPVKGDSGHVENLSRRCKDLESKLEEARREKSTAEEEKTCLLMSLDANIEKKDALEEQLNVLQAKFNEKPGKKEETSASETDGVFRASSYKKDISKVKEEIERIRVQEQDKQITYLKRENEVVKEKLKKAEGMSQTLQNCLKEITDEKNELLDSIEELNEEKAELEQKRLQLEQELGGGKREKLVVDEVSDIRNKERKLYSDIEASKVKLTQLGLQVVEVLSLIGSEEAAIKTPKNDSEKGLDDMIGSLSSTVNSLKIAVTSFKETYEKTKSDSLRMKDERQEVSEERYRLQDRVEELEKHVKDTTASLENKSNSQASKESAIKKENLRLERELEKVYDSRVESEKSLAEARRRVGELERQLKEVRSKRDALQKAFDQLTKQCNETTSRLAETTKQVEESRSTNDVVAKQLEQLREDLEGTVEERDELLELLDRIVCENGSSEKRQCLGLKVERIRERSKSEEVFTDAARGNGKVKIIEKNFVATSQLTVESSPSDGKVTTGRDKRTMKELIEENHQLKVMVEKMVDGQKKMETALSSFSVANAEIQRDLGESIEQTELIQVQGAEEHFAHDVVDYGAEYATNADDTENAELRKLHEAMVGTNEALKVNLRQLEDEKTRAESLRNSWHDMSRKNAALESNVEDLSKDKARLQKKLSTVEEKRKLLEKQTEKAMQEKQDVQNLLDEVKARGNDLKFQVESLTEINQDLRETNATLSSASKETEKKWSKLNDEFDELEFENERLQKASKRLHQELSEIGQQKTAVVLELERSKEMVVSLKSELESHSNRSRELHSTVEANESEFKILRETAGKYSTLMEKADGADVLKSEMDTLKKTVKEREKRVQELEESVSSLKKEIEDSQRLVKAVSQENDGLRDSLSEWDREVSRIRQHVHQVSKEAERDNETNERSSSVKKESPTQVIEETTESMKAFEAMQVEMEAINKHLRSLTSENKELRSTVEKLTKENDEVNDRNIQLLIKHDMVNKEVENKVLEIDQLNKSLKKLGTRTETITESRDKLDRENNKLQTKYGKLERGNPILKSCLVNALDEERVIGKKLKSLIEASRDKLRKPHEENGDTGDRVGRSMDITIEEVGLATEKPDLIRHSKDATDESIDSNSEYFALEKIGAGKDTQELAKAILKEFDSLKKDCQEIARIFKEIDAQDAGLRKELEEAIKAKEKAKTSLEQSKSALEKTQEAKRELESGLEQRESALSKVTEEKTKLEQEATVVKEKSDKLQTVFRALIQVMNDKKGGRQSDEPEGSTRLIDYIKNIKTKYTGLVKEKEDLEEKVNKLQKEVEEYRRKQAAEKESKVRGADSEVNEGEVSKNKSLLQEKEKVLNELLLTSARDKRRFVEKLQELYEEFTRVQTQLDEEVQKRRETSPSSVTIFEKVQKGLVESVTHTETFIQSVVHERRVTVIADSSPENDPGLELAKENEELLGRINANQTNRRREVKNLKEELRKSSKEKEDAVKASEEKWKKEMETAKQEHEQILKEKEELISDAKNSWKEEVDQLKNEMKRISDEHALAQRSSRSESRLLAEKLEEKNRLLKAEVDKAVAEKKENDSKMSELKRKSSAEAKEKAKLVEAEVQHARSSWADVERKLRAVAEEKQNAIREMERANRENGEREMKATREVQKQSAEREDSFRRERERLQRTITLLDEAAKNEVSGLERNQTKISGFQRTLDDLARKNKLLENAKVNSEQSLGAELEKLRAENSKLQREQRRVVVNNKDQSQRMEPSLAAPAAERVKVLGSIKQPVIDKPRLISPVESVPALFSGPGETQRRVKVREGQTVVIHKGRVKEQSAPRTSENNDAVFKELDAVFQKLNNEPSWMDDGRSTTSVIQATPIAARTQDDNYEMQPQMPQPEWAERQERAKPIQKDPRNATAATRQQESSLLAPSAKPSFMQPPLGYRKENELHDHPPKVKPKPPKRQPADIVEASKKKSSSAETLDRPVETKRLAVGRKGHGEKSRRPRRPSIGSDDVFVTESQPLKSHGSKHGDFWRSQSLDNLMETSKEMKVKTSDHNATRKHKPKLPKSFSGPKKFESHSKRENSQTTSSSSAHAHGRSDTKDTKAKKVLPLKGMEYVIFQHQI